MRVIGDNSNDILNPESELRDERNGTQVTDPGGQQSEPPD